MEKALPHTETDVHYVDISPKLWDFSHSVLKWSTEPPGSDIRIAAFAEAVSEEILDPTSADFREILEDFLLTPKNNAPLNYSYKANLLLRALQKQAISDDWKLDSSNPQFPHAFDKRASWHHLIDWIGDDSSRTEEFLFDVTARDVTSNLPKRYKTIPLVVGLYREVYPGRFPTPVTIKDNGCSQNRGLTWLNSRLPTGTIGVVTRNHGRIKYLPHTTEAINNLLRQPFHIGRSVGIDKVPLWDTKAQAWTTACSSYPSEFLQENRLREDEYLRSLKPSKKVNFQMADFTEPKEMANIKKHSFDIDFHSVAYYQLPASMRAKVEQNNQQYVKSGGLAIGQEFAYLNGHNQLSYYSDLNASLYRLGVFVTDVAKRNPSMELFGRWQTGRCNIFELGPLALKLLTELRVDIK